MITGDQKLSSYDDNDQEWDGCRSGKLIPMDLLRRTTGTQLIMSESGFIYKFDENINAESPTYSLLMLIHFMNNNPMIYERIQTIGYDISCSVYKRCKKLLFEKIPDEIPFNAKVNQMIVTLLPIMNIPTFHIGNHTKNDMCINNEQTGFFHRSLNKFRNILHSLEKTTKESNDNKKNKYDLNSEVVEQTWKDWNLLKFLIPSNRRTFNFSMIQWQELHNLLNYNRLISKNFEFKEISSIKKIRSVPMDTNIYSKFPDTKTMQKKVTKVKYENADAMTVDF